MGVKNRCLHHTISMPYKCLIFLFLSSELQKCTKNWSHLPLVSMTSNMFFRLSGRASARMSLLAAAQNWPTRSNMESHSAEKVGRLQRY